MAKCPQVYIVMNHGGPFLGHPGFTAVGTPTTSIQRLAALHCYDKVRLKRLLETLRET
ncbi:MAG: hypothetical protein ACRCYY_19750 [Trueperaceae bacterium]